MVLRREEERRGAEKRGGQGNSSPRRRIGVAFAIVALGFAPRDSNAFTSGEIAGQHGGVQRGEPGIGRIRIGAAIEQPPRQLAMTAVRREISAL